MGPGRDARGLVEAVDAVADHSDLKNRESASSAVISSAVSAGHPRSSEHFCHQSSSGWAKTVAELEVAAAHEYTLA